ncbi:MAG: hypothetical protein VX916_07515 [Planctomycetota bacterium]|nr:hypothetical protein [Planctomycetota bacterium]
MRLLIVAVLTLVSFQEALAQFQVHKVDGGRIAITFFDEVYEDLDLAIETFSTAEIGTTLEEEMLIPTAAFMIDGSSDLLFLSSHAGGFQPYGVLGGAVRSIGGFVVTDLRSGNSVDFLNFDIHPTPVFSDGPGGEPDPDYLYIAQAGDDMGKDFELCYVKISWLPGDGGYGQGEDHEAPMEFRMKAWDMNIGADLAAKLRRPDLLGVTLGYGKVEMDTSVYEGPWDYPRGQKPFTPFSGEPPAESPDGNVLDVKLGILSSYQQKSGAHQGSFPNGIAGMTMSTTSCNVGDSNVPWHAPMSEGHPGISMAMYREMDGRFEQIGVSWMKHGFFALSNSQCTPCQSPSPQGNFLGKGCSDTYGTSNNADPFYLGPRDEWNGFTNRWTAWGSYFDGTPVDGQRDEFGPGGNDLVSHRLTVDDQDMIPTNATYYYEAMYLVVNDQLINNNIGSRTTVPNWNGSRWLFSNGSALVEGPALMRWSDADQITTKSLGGHADGSAILAVDVTALGQGKWRYEYALMNWNMDRKLRSFSVPVCGPVSDLYFHDMDSISQNNWQADVSGGNITWEFNDVVVGADKEAGALSFNFLSNFGFTASAPPGDRQAIVGIHEPGPGGDFMGIDMLAPSCLNLSVDMPSPAIGDAFTMSLVDGTSHGALAVLDVSGIAISPPLLLVWPPLPLVGGDLHLPVTLPNDPLLQGLDIGFVGADTNAAGGVFRISNVMRLDIRDA